MTSSINSKFIAIAQVNMWRFLERFSALHTVSKKWKHILGLGIIENYIVLWSNPFFNKNKEKEKEKLFLFFTFLLTHDKFTDRPTNYSYNN